MFAIGDIVEFHDSVEQKHGTGTILYLDPTYGALVNVGIGYGHSNQYIRIGPQNTDNSAWWFSENQLELQSTPKDHTPIKIGKQTIYIKDNLLQEMRDAITQPNREL